MKPGKTVWKNTVIHFAHLTILFVLLLFTATRAKAEVRLASIFADHMVLQRDRPIMLWGTAPPDDNVTVLFAGQTAEITASSDGAWSVTLKPLAASKTGQPIQVICGTESITIDNVLVGDVWHASGQSNMAMTVGAMAKELDVVQTDIATADLPALRFCRINEAESPEPLSDLPRRATWRGCTPETVSGFSGVAFYFARRLHQELGVPIGVINSSRGGTPIEPFIPRAAFASHPTLRRESELGDRGDLDAIWRLPGGVRARDANWLPGRLFNSRLAPITRFAVRGLIWYQGESNCGDGEDARQYQHKMRALIRGWRDELNDKKLPVYFVQLPGSGAREGWSCLREQQRLAAYLPHTGMVVTVDIDGAGIHPPNKIDVGQRLARWTLAKDNAKEIAFSGPLFDRQEIRGREVVLHFRHAEAGLMVATKDGLAEPRETPNAALAEFEVTDKTGEWHTAMARIVGQTVVVTSAHVGSPTAVRYAYAVTPTDCNLYNRDGLQASPFCSQPDLLKYDPNLPE